MKKDSAEIVFRFNWDSAEVREFMDMRSVSISYSWDAEKYFVSIQHELRISPDNPEVTVHTRSSCSPQLNLDNRELFFVASIDNNLRGIVINEWKLDDNRIEWLHREVISNTKGFRTRKFLFERD